MEDKLNILIAYYEEEKERLLQLIDNYVKEWEYQLAHLHTQALYQLNRRLQTLRNIQEKFYDEKSFKKDTIQRIEEELATEVPDYRKEYLAKELVRNKEALDKLNLLSGQANTLGNSGLFEETLHQLLNKQIKSFKLVFKKSAELLLELKLTTKKLQVTLPYVKRHLKRCTLYEEHITAFKRLGFQLTSGNSKLVLVLTGHNEEMISKLKWILSKIIFEVFYFRQFDNESYIEIKTKQTTNNSSKNKD